METASLTGLIYGTLHGAIDLGGRAPDAKGLGRTEATLGFLLDLGARRNRPGAVAGGDSACYGHRAVQRPGATISMVPDG